jgi:hypothetical protein
VNHAFPNYKLMILFFCCQVFDMLRIIMFVLGMTFVFVGISLLAPDDSKDW